MTKGIVATVCATFLPLSTEAGRPGGSLWAGLAALLALSVLLVLTGWLWYGSSAQMLENAKARFEFRVVEARFTIGQRLLAYEQILLGGLGLFAVSRQVERDEWHAYVSILQIDKNYPGIRGVGFALLIPAGELEEHTRKVRAEGFPEYRVHPPGLRDEYTSVIYLEPFDWRNQRAFGYDMFSEPVRRAAMERARDSGQPAVSGRVTLLMETRRRVQHGFLMYLPLYRDGRQPQTVEQRRAELVGYVYAPFRMNDLMESTLGLEALPNIRLQIYDGTQARPDTLMFDSATSAEVEPPLTPGFSIDKSFEFNGHQWLLRFSSLPGFVNTTDMQQPKLALFGGILVSVLFAAVLWSLSLNRQRALALAVANRGLQSEIEHRTRLEEHLRLAKETAEEANRAKTHFLANVSHELRTPLTLILAPLQQLSAAGRVPRDWREQIARIQRNALRLLSRVNEVLDFSKAEAGKLQAHPEVVELRALIPALAEDAAPVAGRKGCELTWQIAPNLERVFVDLRHFEKIVLNFLSNALKFTPAGGRIHLEAKALDAQWFEFAVVDSGSGIAPEYQSLLFQRFQQLDNSATRKYGGTGIGLALVRQLAELMGGSAGVESEPGRGSRFFVRLPRGTEWLAGSVNRERGNNAACPVELDTLLHCACLQEVIDNTTHTEPVVDDTRSSTTAPRLLVVDDNADMRAYIAELLRDRYAVTTAADGVQAWVLLQRRAFDLVVSDVMMPGLDGFALARRIKQSAALAAVPVILVTARGGSEASTDGLEAGADDYIAKPFAADELRARVRAVLRSANMQRQLRDAAREAGMAMLAGALLHNLGNILNGITTSTAIVAEKLRGSRLGKLHDISNLLRRHSRSLPDGVRDLPEYLERLAAHLNTEREAALREIDVLEGCVAHAAQIVGSHQRFTLSGAQLITEPVGADQLLESALTLARASYDLKRIEIERRYDYTGATYADRHLVLQILVNLIINAGQAVHRHTPAQPRIILGTALTEHAAWLTVSDNGDGIEAANLPRLFNQGFTTRPEGHGCGLHSGANWARQMGGRLSATSRGRGLGATFVLELPLSAASESGRPVAESRQLA